MGRPKGNKVKMCVSISDDILKALNIFSETVHLSKSDIIGIALSQYLITKDVIKDNPETQKLLKDYQL